MSPDLCTISIVSHLQGALVNSLLDDIELHCQSQLEVIVTVNLPENEQYLERPRRFPVLIVRNKRRLGFGLNHNNAFARSRGQYFVVCNPDIRLTMDPLPTLMQVAKHSKVAICGPQVVAPDGTIEDSARRFPTVGSLFWRQLLAARAPDYPYVTEPFCVDWIAGMFMAFHKDSFSSLGGFDAAYDMYFEDVDLCYRARLRGAEVRVVPSCQVVHHARRNSHRDPKHFFWHVQSAARYFFRRMLVLVGRGSACRG